MLPKKLFLSSMVLFVLLGSLIVLVEAEPSWVIWSQTYGGTKENCANSLIETSDGGYAIAGSTRSFGAGDEDFWLIKTNEQGVPEFPSWIILPLVIIGAVVIIVCKQRLTKNCQSNRSY